MANGIDMAHSELRGLVIKAARGAGLAWGLAEEAGWAAEWLARRAMPAGDWAAEWLAESLSGEANPVEFGTVLADRLAFGTDSFPPQPVPEGLCAPGFLLPFLHLVANHRGAVEIAAASATAVSVDAEGHVLFGPVWAKRAQGWHVQSSRQRGDARRASPTLSVVECLEGLALRTTVPPSEASRRNAGSASSDND